jgi:hypothetical protein
MFGDVVTFDEHLEQLHGYVNRYGKGLVIYWHGVVRQVIDRSPSVMAIDRYALVVRLPYLHLHHLTHSARPS